MLGKVLSLVVILLFTGYFVIAEPLDKEKIFEEDEIHSVDIEGDWVVVIGGNMYYDYELEVGGGKPFGVWLYNIKTEQWEIISNYEDDVTERHVSIDGNRVYWWDNRLWDSTVWYYDILTEQEYKTNISVIDYIENHYEEIELPDYMYPRPHIQNSVRQHNGTYVWIACPDVSCYKDALYMV